MATVVVRKWTATQDKLKQKLFSERVSSDRNVEIFSAQELQDIALVATRYQTTLKFDNLLRSKFLRAQLLASVERYQCLCFEYPSNLTDEVCFFFTN